MNVTNSVITQISIEVIGGIVTLLFSMVITLNRTKRRSAGYFSAIFLLTSFIFFSEALSYLTGKNVSTFAIIGSEIGNFATFFFNVALANVFIRFVCSLLKEKSVDIGRAYIRVANILAILAIAILIINQFTGWMYRFDELNYYHRETMWYVYTLLCFMMIFTGAVISVRYRKEIGRSMYIAALIYVIFPIIAVLLQVVLYGYPIVNISLGISAILMFINYAYDLNKNGVKTEKLSQMENARRDTLMMFSIMAMCVSASIITGVISINKMSVEVSDRNSTITSIMTESEIMNEMIRPISVSEALSNDASLKEYLKISRDEESAKAVEDEMIEYLDSIKTGFGYQMAFAVSDASKAYYTYQGISTFLDPKSVSHDIWYDEYVKSQEKYIINVDTDEDNNWALSVFINTGIYDEDGSFLGVCGVGVEMVSLQNLITRLEDEYGIRVYLTNKEGLVQISSNGEEIENRKLDTSDFSEVAKGGYLYVRKDEDSRFTEYIPELGWYLIIHDYSPDKLDVGKVIILNVVVFAIGIMAILLALFTILKRDRRVEKELLEKRKASITDGLTGLKNRRGYEEDIESLATPKELERVCLIMMDINGLKFVNDNIGHNAGDELIKGAAHCINEAYGEYGEIYRTGGDEFVAILRASIENVRKAEDILEKSAKEWRGELVDELAISKGTIFCDEYPGKSFSEIVELADKLMYEDKERYYRETGRDRRSR